MYGVTVLLGYIGAVFFRLKKNEIRNDVKWTGAYRLKFNSVTLFHGRHLVLLGSECTPRREVDWQIQAYRPLW